MTDNIFYLGFFVILLLLFSTINSKVALSISGIILLGAILFNGEKYKTLIRG